LLRVAIEGHDLPVWPKRDGATDVIELLEGIGRMLHEIDAKLQQITDLFGEDRE